MRDMRDIGKIIGDADSRAKVHAVKKVITKANAGESIDVTELLDMAQGIDSDALAEADHAEMAGYFASHVKMLAERDFTPASNRSPTDSSMEFEGVLVGFMRKDLSKKAEVVLSTSRALMKLQRETAMLNVTVVDDCDGDSGSTSEKQASAVKRELAKVTKMLKMKFDDEVISSGEVASIFQDRATSIVDVSTGLCMRVTQACLKRREFVLAGARLKAQSLSVDNSDLMGWVERDKLTWEDLKAKAQELLDGASVDGIFNALGNIEQALDASSVCIIVSLLSFPRFKAQTAVTEYAEDMALKPDADLIGTTPDLTKKVAIVGCEIQLMQAFCDTRCKDK
eukprot:9501205-Pyramimonas_sp.AAC.1